MARPYDASPTTGRRLASPPRRAGPDGPLTGKLAPAQEWKPWSTALQKILKRDLTLREKNEWLAYFGQHQQQARQRQHLARLDAELDQLVYALNGLTEAEIALVAGGAAA